MNPTSIREVPSLASLGGLRTQHCPELWYRLHTRLGSGLAVAVAWAGGCNSIPTLAQEFPYATGTAIKSQNKQTKMNGDTNVMGPYGRKLNWGQVTFIQWRRTRFRFQSHGWEGKGSDRPGWTHSGSGALHSSVHPFPFHLFPAGTLCPPPTPSPNPESLLATGHVLRQKLFWRPQCWENLRTLRETWS